MARLKQKSKLKRNLIKTKKSILRFLTHPVARNVLAFFLLLGIFYFSFMGAMTVAFRTSSFWMSVISNSMKHNGESWRNYYETMGENSYRFPLQGGFEKGDLLIVQGINSVSEISVGDVIIVSREGDLPLAHRVAGMWEQEGEVRIITKGDNNTSVDSHIVKPKEIIGKVVFVIPKLGCISLWFQGR